MEFNWSSKSEFSGLGFKSVPSPETAMGHETSNLIASEEGDR